MKIHIYTIHKNENLEFNMQYYQKGCKGFGVEINFYNVFNKFIQDAHKKDSLIAKQSYSKAFEKYLDGNSILLDSTGIHYDTHKFSQMVEKHFMHGILKFFIAGAFGFEKSLVQKYPVLSLSKLTFSHEIAKLVLVEQIYRSLSIIKNHPYHKN